MKTLITSLLFSFLTVYAQDVPKDEHLFVVSGVIVNSQSTQKVNNFVQMIESKTGYPLKPFYVDSYTRLSQTLREHPRALAWTCGAPYVEDSIKDQQQLIAVPLFMGHPTYRSFIVTRMDTGKNELKDFKNKVFSYSDPRSNSGYLAPAIHLKKQGASIDDFFRLKLYAKTHERSIESIYRGMADVGAIDEYVWIHYTKTRPKILKKLHVIEKIGPFPFTPIVAGKGVEKKMIKKIQTVLTQMNDTELQRFKNDFNLDGFVVKREDFYQPIKDMLNKIKR